MRTLHHADFDAATLASKRAGSVSVCLPAKGCAATVGPIAEALRALPIVDEVVVVAPDDATLAAARAVGATALDEADLEPDLGPVQGKGDAMWRALRALRGDVVAFLDADLPEPAPHFAVGLLGPLLTDPATRFAKALYRRPFAGDPAGGGRVNHLMARPALAVFHPRLRDVRQPLAGEFAARRELLERIPFVTGWGVEIGMVIDVEREAGLDAMVQVDLGEMRHEHKALRDLTPMAEVALRVAARRAGIDVDAPPERPPWR